MNLIKSQKEIIFVAGHNGLVGSSLVRFLKKNTNDEIVTRTHDSLDLTNQSLVREFFNKNSFNSIKDLSNFLPYFKSFLLVSNSGFI